LASKIQICLRNDSKQSENDQKASPSSKQSLQLKTYFTSLKFLVKEGPKGDKLVIFLV
jgi:hypothetical protein